MSGISTATCNDGDLLLGGGANVTTSGGPVAALQFSMPDPNDGSTPTGWQAQAVELTSSIGQTFTVTAYAICGTGPT